MAKGQQAGTGAITVWMIIFVALWLTSTVFLVVLYTGQEELNDEVSRLRRAKDQLISSSEESSIEHFREAHPASEGGPTLVGLLENARRETALLATGDETDDVEAGRRKRDQLAEEMADDRLVPRAGEYAGKSLYDGMVTLYGAFKAEHALRIGADDRTRQLEGDVARLVEQNAEQKNDFDARAGELGDLLTKTEADRAAAGAQRDAAATELQREFDERRTQADADLTRERQRSAGLQRDLAELRKRFVAQQQKFGAAAIGPAELSTARQPDGLILTAVPGDDVVYINLGTADRVMLGMRFSVYAADTGIPADGRAKAQLEVVSISEASSECKIVGKRRNQVVLAGDLVANPIFDADRRLVFLTVGRFDLDHDGEFDAEGLETVEAIISAWGGEITDELTTLTDFVIVGAAPRRPRDTTDATPLQRGRNQEIQRDWDDYHETLASTRNLSIPAMSQEVFLNFLGQARYPYSN